MSNDEFMKCSICGEFFNPAFLSQVVEHMHKDMKLDKEYYGTKIKEDKNDLS